MERFKGIGVSKGAAVGAAMVYRPFRAEVHKAYIEDTALAVSSFHRFREAAKAELAQIQERLSDAPDKAAIFAAHSDMIDDEEMIESTIELITDELFSPEWAVATVFDRFINIMNASDDTYMKERAADMLDVRNRLLRCAAGTAARDLSRLDAPCVVVAHDLFPSDTATMDRNNVLAIVTEIGGGTSHSAIIARSYGIPAVLGAAEIMDCCEDGQILAVDAVGGTIYVDPGGEMIAFCENIREVCRKDREINACFANKEPVTLDGQRVQVMLNIGSPEGAAHDAQQYCDGVGLFRTEFLYMEKDALPSEDEQYDAYRQVLEAFGDRPVVLRTLDIGGDKTLSYWHLPKEENPFLGRRALRLCFDFPEIFRTQLRAALRASAHGNLWLMLPMVGRIEDIRAAKSMIDDVRQALDAEGVPYGKDMKIGIMIEIPSIAMMADLVAEEVDFASIGTNDLCQYLTASDRMNPEVSAYYQEFHPGMFRMISQIGAAFAKAGKPLCVCGEMGGMPAAVYALLGAGVSKFSMNPSSVGAVKRLILSCEADKAKAAAERVCRMATAEEAERFLTEEVTRLTECETN